MAANSGTSLSEAFELAKYPDLTLLTPEEERSNRRERIKEVVRLQKEAVNDRLKSKRLGISSDSGFELSNEEMAPIVNSANSVFPKWMHRHPDFQRAFPRFATEKADEISAVEVIMSKTPEQRCRDDVQNLVRFIQKFPPIRDHRELSSPQAIAQVSRIISFCEYKQGYQVFTEKQQANSFYIILRGHVNLTSSQQENISWSDAFATATNSEGEEKILEQNSNDMPKNETSDKSQSGQSTRRIGPYTCFGIKALSNSIDEYQTFGAQVCKNSLLLRIRSHEFRDALKKFRESLNSSLVRFLQEEVNLFHNWSKHRVNQLTPYLTTEHVDAGGVILRGGEQVDELYFIRKGSCEAIREIAYRQYNQWPKNRRKGYNVLEFEVTKPMRVTQLNPGDYVGGDFLFPERRVGNGNQCTVCAIDDVELCVLSKRHAKKLFGNRTIEMIRSSQKKLDCSEDQLRANYVASVRLNKKYDSIRNSTIGPRFEARSSTSSKTLIRARTAEHKSSARPTSRGAAFQSVSANSAKGRNVARRPKSTGTSMKGTSLPVLSESVSTSVLQRGRVRTRLRSCVRETVSITKDRNQIIFKDHTPH